MDSFLSCCVRLPPILCRPRFGTVRCLSGFHVPPPPRSFPRHRAAQRIVVASRAAEIAGFPALRTALEACACPGTAPLPDTPAFIPTNATATAPAVAMARILRCVARSAPSKVWVISVSSRPSEALLQERTDDRFPDRRSRIYQLRPGSARIPHTSSNRRV